MRLTSDKRIPQPRIAVIFRGAGRRIRQEEKGGYDSRVDVEFQPNAWADTEYTAKWVKKTLRRIQEDVPGNSILFLDNLTAQVSEEFSSECRKVDVKTHFFPANCTDIVQPVDHHVGINLKNKIGDMMLRMFSDDPTLEDRWLGIHEAGPMPLWERRVLITKWVAEAWSHVCSNMDFGLIGFSTGCNMTSDGFMENGKGEIVQVPPIKIAGVDNYTYNDVDLSEYPADSGDEASEDEDEDNMELPCEITEGDFDKKQGEADSTYDDTAEVQDVPTPSADLMDGLEVLPLPELKELEGSSILFKLDYESDLYDIGWYMGKVYRKVSAKNEIDQGYNYNVKFTRDTTAKWGRAFAGTVACLLNHQTYGLEKQWVLVKARR